MKTQYSYSISIKITSPPGRVWAIMSDVERWPRWTSIVRKIKRLDSGPLAVGSKAWIYQPKLLPARWVVAAMEPPRGFTWITSVPGILVRANHAIEPISNGSLVTLSITYTGFLSPLISRLTAKVNTKYLGIEARGLKKRCEDKSASQR